MDLARVTAEPDLIGLEARQGHHRPAIMLAAASAMAVENLAKMRFALRPTALLPPSGRAPPRPHRTSSVASQTQDDVHQGH